MIQVVMSWLKYQLFDDGLRLRIDAEA